MRQIFFDIKNRNNDIIVLTGPESHHISRVLRLAPGTKLLLNDGNGSTYDGVILESSTIVKIQILCSSQVVDDSTQLDIYQAVLKGKNMDLIVQKCTELGVSNVHPIVFSRCQGRANSIRRKKRLSRWNRIIEASCKQSGRLLPMQIHEEILFPQLSFPEKSPEDKSISILLWEKEQNTKIQEIIPKNSNALINLMLGPEGGFTYDEVTASRLSGWQTAGLGQLILRGETATIASVAIVQNLLGNL